MTADYGHDRAHAAQMLGGGPLTRDHGPLRELDYTRAELQRLTGVVRRLRTVRRRQLAHARWRRGAGPETGASR